ncbi:MAG: hypothetical protein IT548_16590 [Alphaproteobacteria bacterium]|nr:hypothetical protein [Alphaproteobacteria bacterium]
MRRRFKSLGMFLLGFVLGTALSVAFAQAVRAEPEELPGYDLPVTTAAHATL